MDRLQAMRQFVTVVDTGSFSAAARVLAMGQPAVSRAVAGLEAQLGVRLLSRTTRAHNLTDAGRRYYEHARIALDEAEAAEAAARDEAASLSGRLRIAAPPVYASLHLIPRLDDFMQHHPDMDIDLVLDDRHVDLVGEGIDLAIRAGELQDSSATARRIDSAKRLVVASADYVRAHGSPRSPQDLLHHRVLAYTEYERLTTWRFARGEETVSIAVRGHLRVSAAEGLRAAVLANLGITLTSERMFPRELACGTVVPQLTDWSLPEVPVFAVFPPGRRSAHRAHLFVDWLSNAMRQPMPDRV
ncbi:LysR substrate-binding domain-containing protein [Algiphilus sp.]|uniref:LysR family transcriptional regulator n=1 Tax=Algiphilus sp. TaxID=1872431 RepID=UPI003B520A78